MQFKKGISEKQINQLIYYTNNDLDIGKFTSDLKRFKNRQMFDKWQKKKRTIFTITDEKSNLLGIFWIGEEDLAGEKIPNQDLLFSFKREDYGITFAVRIYGQARGKGLAKEFIERSFKEFNAKKKIWLDTKVENERAISLYKKLGFKTATRADKEGWIIMIQEESHEAHTN
ncbi:GNAT family N-acetyltransferase [Candidatus Daviesbacteria bacterium]|nr:GNAT family N-acetyltransferase [Candidatus Daviesbacteria bacterium]